MPADTWELVDTTDDRVRTGLERLAERRRGELAAGARHTGWKVGFNDANARAMIGLRTGVVGYLTDRSRSDAGDVAIPDAGVAGEIELAFRLASAVGANASDDDALGAIAAVAPAIEVVVFADMDVEDMLARDVWHHAYALGADTTWEPAVIDALTVDAHHNATPLDVPRPAADKLAFVPDMLRFVASGAEAIGARLDAGDIVLSGSLAASLAWLDRGDTLTATMGPLGAVRVASALTFGRRMQGCGLCAPTP